MMVKFETDKGYKVFDGFESVEWTFDCVCENKDVNVVKIPFNPLKTTNYQYINDVFGPDEMAGELIHNRVVGMKATDKEQESMVCVDEVFANEDPDSDRHILFHCFGGGKLKLYYTERPAYLLNDSGKTVERI